jgi:hypothetical protein
MRALQAKAPRRRRVGVAGVSALVMMSMMAVSCTSDAVAQRPELPAPNPAVSALVESIPAPAWVRYASGDTAPVQIAGGTTDLAACSEELWSARRQPSSPEFEAAGEPSATVDYLAGLFDAVYPEGPVSDSPEGEGPEVTVPLEGLAVGRSIVVDGVTYHRGVSRQENTWMVDRFQTTGPLLVAALFGASNLTVPLCDQARGLPLVLGDPVTLSDALSAGVDTALDTSIAEADTEQGLTRVVAGYDQSRVDAVFDTGAYDVATEALGLSGRAVSEFVTQSPTPPADRVGDVRVEFVQRDGVVERIVVRRLSDAVVLDVIAFTPRPGWAPPSTPSDGREIEYSPGS